MADQNSVTFWSEVAARYRHDGRVMFELYNEPHDVSWDVWLNGGDGHGFRAAGMQQLYDAVRAARAENLVLVGGLDWAYDLSGLPSHPIADLHDRRRPGHNLAYVTHVYDFPGKQKGDWDRAWGFLTKHAPVVMTEFGDYDCGTAYYADVLAYARAHGASWTAWAWWVGGCSFPSILSDWRGTPNGPGELVKSALASF